jgi:hypothetical protein
MEYLPPYQGFKPGELTDAVLWHATSEGFLRMIRITTLEGNHTLVTIDGQVAESDLNEIKRVRKTVKGTVLLNLSGVAECAPGGVRVLRAWLEAGAQLQEATPFLRMLLENTPSSSDRIQNKGSTPG